MDIMDVLGAFIMIPLIFGFAIGDVKWSQGSHFFRETKKDLWDN
jgi:hypothetical protein